MTSSDSPARRPGEPALTTLGLGAPTADPADTSPYAFPDGGTWRTEVPSVEGPEALSVVLKESSRLDVPIHRISQGSGIWMLSDAEITEMVEGCAERGVELCLFTGPAEAGTRAHPPVPTRAERGCVPAAMTRWPAVSKTPCGHPSWE